MYPSRYSYTDVGANQIGLKIWTGGLCGQWANGQVSPINCDLFWRSGTEVNCVGYGDETNGNFVNYWKLKDYLDRQPVKKQISNKEINLKRLEQLDKIDRNVEELQKKMNVYRKRMVEKKIKF